MMKHCIAFILISIPLLGLAQNNQLLVGFSDVDLEPQIGIPLAGYGSKERRLPHLIDWGNRHSEAFFFKPSVGIHSPIRAKTMVLKKGEKYLILLSMDTVGLEYRFIRDLAKNLKSYGISKKDIFASATHTHGGPGTLSRRLPLQLVASDFFKRKNYKNILRKTISCIEKAIESLEPADLFKTEVMIEGVQRNKWRRKDEEHFDKRAAFLVARSKTSDHWLGGVVNFAVHGGTMPIEILEFSSDINGAIERKLEQLFEEKNVFSLRPPVFLFLNGAEGDVGTVGARSVEAIETLSKLFIDQAAPAFNEDRLTPVNPDFFITDKKIFLGIPALSLKCHVGLFRNLPVRLKIGIWPFLPAHSHLSLATIGDITLLSWPGEPSTQLGYDLKKMARERGAKDPWIISLANDYATYFTTKSEYKESKYDSCSSLYGFRGGRRIIRAHAKLMDRYLK